MKHVAFFTLCFLGYAELAAAQSEDSIDLQIEDYDETVCYVNCGSSNNLPEEFITHTYTRVIVQAKANSVTVESVEINRGNCRYVGGVLPQELNFGEQVTVVVQKNDTIFSKGCNIIEVKVLTDKGEITFAD